MVFTESQRTQSYLFSLLERSGYQGEVVMLNGGGHNDDRSKQLYKEWLARHEGKEVVAGSRPVDVKAAIVEAFASEPRSSSQPKRRPRASTCSSAPWS